MILGRGFRGALNYVAAAAKSATTDHKGFVPPFLTNMAGATGRELAAEFGTLRNLRPNLTKAVGHLILSHDPTQRPLTESEWKSAIQIALLEHGADQAAFAAWQHFDTDASHFHVIFSRVLTTNQVVCDSNSYRKNERAARLIERTFMLDTPTPTPTPAADRLGDRKAVYNAKKRAERTGTPDPTLISPQTVREALAAAKNLGEYQRQLEERDIEIEFDRRGAEQEIYGCRLRRKGAAEWLKASSIHKDLSWPKIAHRFAESISTKQTPTEQPVIPAKTAPTALVQRQEQLDRPPQQLQQIPQAMYAANQMHPQVPVVKRLGEVSDRLDQMAPAMNTPFLNCSWALARLLVEASKMAVALGAALLRFLKHVLSYFGLATREPLQFQEQAVTPQLTYNPTKHGLVLNEEELKELDKTATAAVNGVLNAVVNNKPNDLAAVPGRAELVAAMAAENIKTGTPAVGESNPLDSMFDAHVTQPAPKIEPDAAQPDTLVLLNIAKKEFFTASIQKSDAREKETNQVVAARKNHEMAVRRLKQAKLDYFKEKERKGRWAFLLPSEAVVVEDEQIEFDRAELGLANAIQQHPIVVPPELVQKFGDALEKVKTAAQMHHAQMVRDVAKFDNAKVKKIAVYQAQSFKANFEIFERAPQVGYLDIAFKVAEAAPNSISTAQNLAEREEKIQAERQAYVPENENVDNIERPGQK